MEKGTKGLRFLIALILGVMLIAWTLTSPLTAAEKAVLNQPVFSADMSSDTVIIDSGFTPPEPLTASSLPETRIETTEITSDSRSLVLFPQKLSLQSYSISPREMALPTRQQGNAGFTAALASTVVLHAADYYTTVNALKYSTLQEGNPFMKKIVSNHLLFGAIKLGVAGLQVTLLKGLYKKNKTLAWVVGTAMNVALSGVVANNLSKIQKAKSCFGY